VPTCQAEGTAAQPLKKETRGMSGKKILVVEDEVTQLTSVGKRLKAAGYEVSGARDGMNAIAMARREMPDLVLLDLGLPGGDGFTVLKRLQLIIHTSMIPVIVMSARDPHGNRDEALKSGAVAYLQKPLDTDVLLKTVAKALGMEEAQAPSQQT
jgi:twitching motility two-component system response regulator PilH